MLHPSYTDLMEAVNTNSAGNEAGEHPVVQSRYSIVIATAKRARQLIAGQEALIENAEGRKPLSIAVEELYTGKVQVLGDEDEEEEMMDEDLDGTEETAEA